MALDLEDLYIETHAISKVMEVYISYTDEIESSCLFFLSDSLKDRMEQMKAIYMKR